MISSWRQRNKKKQAIISQLHEASMGNLQLTTEIKNDVASYAMKKLQDLESNLRHIKKSAITTNDSDSIEIALSTQNHFIADLIQTVSQISDSSCISLRQQVFITAMENIKKLHLSKTNYKNCDGGNEFDDRRDHATSFTINHDDNNNNNNNGTDFSQLTAKYPLVDIHAQMQDVKNVIEKHHKSSKMRMRHVPSINDMTANQFEANTFTYNVMNGHNKDLQSLYEMLYTCDQYDSIDIFKFDHLTDGWAMSLLLPIMFEQYNFFDSSNMGSKFIDSTDDQKNVKQLPLFVDRSVLFAFLDKIQINYFDVPYHNRIHAADVLQTAFFWLSRKDSPLIKLLTKEDIFSILISCVIHDLQHPGTSQMFLLQAEHPITRVYNDSDVLEHMHLSQAFLMIKSDESVNIFKHLTKRQISAIKRDIIDCVLATNFAHQGKIKSEMKTHIERAAASTHITRKPSLAVKKLASTDSVASVHSIQIVAQGSLGPKPPRTNPGLSISTEHELEMANVDGDTNSLTTPVCEASPSSNRLSVSNILRGKYVPGHGRSGSRSTSGQPNQPPKPTTWKSLSRRFSVTKRVWKTKKDSTSKSGSPRSGTIPSKYRIPNGTGREESSRSRSKGSKLVNHVDEIQVEAYPIDFLDNREQSRTIVSTDSAIERIFVPHDNEVDNKPIWSTEISNNLNINNDEININNRNNITNHEKLRSLLRRSIVHAADISHCAKTLCIHQEWSERYYQETYVEKHILKTMNIVQQVNMKRKDFPKEQVWFIANLAHPFYELFCKFINSKECKKILQNVELNLDFWKNDPRAATAHQISNKKYAVFSGKAPTRTKLLSRTLSSNQQTNAK